ncbi:MAG: hypothetical protein ABW352_15570 [Polyangiales bacterium]
MNSRQHIARRRAHRIQAGLLALGFTFASCSDDSGGGKGIECNAAFLEADLDSSPFMGPGVDQGELKLAPDHEYVVSTTYGVPNRGADGTRVPPAYTAAFGAIQEQLGKQRGLIAYQLGSSEACGSGRTLAIWESEDAMYDFVVSPAHLAAMMQVNALLEPGYAVAHYNAHDAREMTFAASVAHALADR